MGSYIVSHKLLRNYMYHFLFGRMPMHTFFTVTKEEAIDCGLSSLLSLLTYEKFRAAWYSYLNLLDVSFSEGFSCSECRSKPTTIVFDATTLSFRKQATHLLTDDVNDSRIKPIKRTSHFKDRIFISDQETRSLLKRFSSRSGKKSKVLDIHEYKSLLTLLQEHSPELHDLLVSFQRDTVTEDHSYGNFLTNKEKLIPSLYKCPRIWSQLISSLASPSPVCGLLHPDESLLDLLNHIITTTEPIDIGQLVVFKEKCPVLFNLFMSCENNKPPDMLKPVLIKMMEKAVKPFQTRVEWESLNISQDSSAKTPYSYWPALPQLRRRGVYETDKRKSKTRGEQCTKLALGHSFLLPGIFTLFCKHEICYGFQVMLSSESPNVPFEVIFTRFEEAPLHCIYDNACNLHDFVLNRQPSFFAKTKFFVDKFHWPGHTGCSIGYKLENYPHLNKINDQINEQTNACLKRIKPQLSYMTSHNFMKHCSFFLWFRNELTKRRMLKERQ
ncbi:uncharacterized protein LOC135685015 [Rhopilema esculentum]|uniref:uncharacterized protein LOC135685015 n=1 Tax=Rhopilema esculentum TaxID=499914 RepID=UPI0031D8F11E